MNETKKINQLEDLVALILSFGNTAISAMSYRGIRDERFPLVPHVGRVNSFRDKKLTAYEEKEMLELFKQQAIQHLDYVPANEWEWLGLAQHYGLPTRLLDWSHNPLVACWFAVKAESETDSALYVIEGMKAVDISKTPNPFGIEEVARYYPMHCTSRITAQSAHFTVHPDAYIPFEQAKKYVIPNEARSNIKKDLHKMGVNSSTVYPDLDGIAKYIKWWRTESY